MIRRTLPLSTRPVALRAAAVLPLLLLLAVPAQADWIVAEGWNLFETSPATFFDPGSGPILFDGLPIEQFDFGGSIGVQDTGTADTIVERLAAADSGGAPGTDTIPIQLVALQLVSSDGSNLFMTLQSERDPGMGDPAPGPASTGTMKVTFTSETEGTFNSILDVWFDLRTGSPTGTIVQSEVVTLTTTNVAWGRTAPPGAVTIQDVNFQLKGDGTTDQDFWPDDFTESSIDFDHVVGPARVPEFCVGAGWDLFETLPGTELNGDEYEGVPLGSFDFGGSIGVQNAGTADTIVRRDQNALGVDPGDSATIPIEMVALQLRSVDPVDLGSGLDTHWVTLQSNRGSGDPPAGPASQGTMTFTFDSAENGTFTSSLDIWFDVRQGSPDGPIVFSGQDRLSTSDPVPWDRTPPPDAVVIPGVNHLLVQDSSDWDLWPHGSGTDGGFSHGGLVFTVHTIRSARAEDFGDAPAPYPTLLASDGARHGLSDLFLGACVDAESDGQPTAAADGDDGDTGSPVLGGCAAAGDDEDGVAFTSDLIQGGPGSAEVTVSDDGRLDAWIDWNADGDWDAGEQVFSDEPVSAGTTSLPFSVPAAAATTTIFARFRLSSEGGLAPTGFAADGEVEDHPVTVLDADTFRSDVVGTKEVTGGTLAHGGSVVYTVVLTNLGPGLQQDNPGDEFVDALPPELALVSAVADSGAAAADPGTNTVTWNGEIPSGGTVTLTIEATIVEGILIGTEIANQGTILYDADGLTTNEATNLTDDPSTSEPEDPTVFPVGAASILEIPTLDQIALFLLALLLAAAGALSLRL